MTEEQEQLFLTLLVSAAARSLMSVNMKTNAREKSTVILHVRLKGVHN